MIIFFIIITVGLLLPLSSIIVVMCAKVRDDKNKAEADAKAKAEAEATLRKQREELRGGVPENKQESAPVLSEDEKRLIQEYRRQNEAKKAQTENGGWQGFIRTSRKDRNDYRLERRFSFWTSSK